MGIIISQQICLSQHKDEICLGLSQNPLTLHTYFGKIQIVV